MSENCLAIIGWVANVLLIICAWGVGHRYRWALLCGALGGYLWAIKAILTFQWDLLFIEIVLSSLQVWAWVKWGRHT
jgi:hypothetical protein